ncbi:MAG TPA: c-type cytochrome, partial [Burkholderiaceae bacterium]
MLKQPLFPILLLALLGACSKTEQVPAASAPATSAAVATAAPVAGGDLAKGEHVYKGTCAMCHATGTAGAPLFGSKADWDPRIAQGK